MASHFFAYLSRMRYIKRWSLMRNVEPENDMEHSMQAALIANALAHIGNTRYKQNYNADRVMALALFHDCSEVITGDLPTPVKYNNPQIKAEYHKIEALARSRLIQMLPHDLQEVYQGLIEPDEKSPEYLLVKAADRLCAYIKCLEETKAGNQEFLEAKEAIQASIYAIDLPEVRDFIAEFIPSFGMTLDQISR